MNFSQLASMRYSVRSFKDSPIEPQVMEAVLEAARIAPTAHNNQPQRIKVITSAEELAKVDECTRCRFGAPALLLICYDKTKSWVRKYDGEESGVVDASIVTMNLILAGWEHGLGSCWVMHFNPAKTREVFKLPDDIIPVAMLPLGYPAEDAKPMDMHYSRLPLSEMLLP